MFQQSELNNRQSTLRLHKYDYAIVIGVGGIGSWVALDLALSGQVKNMILFDPDTLESSNLNRTPFKLDQVDVPKVWAMKELILERRLTNVVCYEEKFDDKSIAILQNEAYRIAKNTTVIVDCRDEIYHDMGRADCKKWKLGYDGLSITIDGNPDETVVFGQGNGYSVTPSFICPSQLIANLVVNHILVNTKWFGDAKSYMDKDHQFNKILTLDTGDLLTRLYEMEEQQRLEDSQNGDKISNAGCAESDKTGPHNDKEATGGDVLEQLSVEAAN